MSPSNSCLGSKPKKSSPKRRFHSHKAEMPADERWEKGGMSKGNSEASALTIFEALGGGGNSGATLLLLACSLDPRLVLMVSTEHSSEQRRHKV